MTLAQRGSEVKARNSSLVKRLPSSFRYVRDEDIDDDFDVTADTVSADSMPEDGTRNPVFNSPGRSHNTMQNGSSNGQGRPVRIKRVPGHFQDFVRY